MTAPTEDVEELALTGLRRALTAVNVATENAEREVKRAHEAYVDAMQERSRLAERGRVLSDAIDGFERTEPLQHTAAQGAEPAAR